MTREVALSYGQQRGDEGTRFSEHQVFARWFPERSEPRQAHPFFNNANAAIRRSLWEIHSYDESLPGLEDLAWASWAMDQGWGIAYVAEAPVIHVHEETLQLIYNRYRREAMALRTIRPSEHFSLCGLRPAVRGQRRQRSVRGVAAEGASSGGRGNPVVPLDAVLGHLSRVRLCRTALR